MLSESQRLEFARSLFEAERQHTPIASLTEVHPDADVIDAYAIAMHVTECKVQAGNVIKGHKIGLTSQAVRQRVGATEPDFGTLFADLFIPEGTDLSIDDFSRQEFRVEIELAFILGKELSGPHLNVADVIRAVDYVVPAIELVGTHFSGNGPGSVVVDAIADGAKCAGVILGGNPRRLEQVDIRNINGSLAINDEVLDSGCSSAVMGNPLTAVTWLANTLSGFGITLEPGHVVMSGSFIRTFPLSAGDSVVATFDEFGLISFTMN